MINKLSLHLSMLYLAMILGQFAHASAVPPPLEFRSGTISLLNRCFEGSIDGQGAEALIDILVSTPNFPLFFEEAPPECQSKLLMAAKLNIPAQQLHSIIPHIKEDGLIARHIEAHKARLDSSNPIAKLTSRPFSMREAHKTLTALASSSSILGRENASWLAAHILAENALNWSDIYLHELTVALGELWDPDTITSYFALAPQAEIRNRVKDARQICIGGKCLILDTERCTSPSLDDPKLAVLAKIGLVSGDRNVWLQCLQSFLGVDQNTPLSNLNFYALGLFRLVDDDCTSNLLYEAAKLSTGHLTISDLGRHPVVCGCGLTEQSRVRTDEIIKLYIDKIARGEPCQPKEFASRVLQTKYAYQFVRAVCESNANFLNYDGGEGMCAKTKIDIYETILRIQN